MTAREPGSRGKLACRVQSSIPAQATGNDLNAAANPYSRIETREIMATVLVIAAERLKQGENGATR